LTFRQFEGFLFSQKKSCCVSHDLKRSLSHMADEEPQKPQEPKVVDATVQEKKTGPLGNIFWIFSKAARDNSKHMKKNQRIMYGPDPQSEGEQETDDFRRQRRLIETFSEDYLGWSDRAKLAAAKFVAFALLVLAVAAVGT